MAKSRVETLRLKAVELLERSKYPMEAEELLERIIRLSHDENEHALFARQRLAELHLESDPWSAAIHIRRVVRARPDDHSAHALLGLAHGLLRNYRLAVRCFERASDLAPAISSYHHNLGHFLDQGLSDPKAALGPLRMACSISPENDEIVASYAQALARSGDTETAVIHARRAARLNPKHKAHAELVRLLEGDESSEADWSSLRELLRKCDNEEGALELLKSFLKTGEAFTNHDAIAAAIDYLSGPVATQKEVAARHGVGISTMRRRIQLIESALGHQF